MDFLLFVSSESLISRPAPCMINCIRFVKSVLKALGRSNTTAALLSAKLTLYQPSWASNKRCVLGPHILFDCKVTFGLINNFNLSSSIVAYFVAGKRSLWIGADSVSYILSFPSLMRFLRSSWTIYAPIYSFLLLTCVSPHKWFLVFLVRRKVITGHDGEPEVDYSSYDTVLACPKGTQPGLYIDEDAFHKVK